MKVLRGLAQRLDAMIPLALAGLQLRLILTRRLSLYINPSFHWLTWCSMGVLFLLGLAGLARPSGKPSVFRFLVSVAFLLVAFAVPTLVLGAVP